MSAWLEPVDLYESLGAGKEPAVRVPIFSSGLSARVRVGARYLLRVEAPHTRHAQPLLLRGSVSDEVVFKDEDWWDAAVTEQRAANARRPVSKRTASQL